MKTVKTKYKIVDEFNKFVKQFDTYRDASAYLMMIGKPLRWRIVTQ